MAPPFLADCWQPAAANINKTDIKTISEAVFLISQSFLKSNS
jgi:hypothetical protein